MPRYALLILPSANRVYASAAVGMTCGELALIGDRAMGGRLSEVEAVTIGGVPYVAFSADELTERDTRLLANASTVYALFEWRGATLEPVELQRLDVFDDDLITIQRYSGKTNEQFTKLLLNVTMMTTAFAGELPDRRFRVLDPVAGRGTTLNQALLYGFDAAGLEIDGKDFDAYSAFIQTWLKNKRIKHRAELGAVRKDKQTLGRRLHVEFAPTKELYKAGRTIELTYVNAETTLAAEFFRPASFDVIVGDMPYGVHHGSRTADKGLSRRPVDLLRAALPTWFRLLRDGGAIGLSWNVHVARREEAVGVLAEAGFEVRDDGAYQSFQHRVDQAILRDIVVAFRP